MAPLVFQEARVFSRRDGGRLWRTYLESPILVLDVPAGWAWANQSIPGWQQQSPGVWHGPLPDPPYSGLFESWGRRWVLLRLPLPEDPGARDRLLLRALFRRVAADRAIPIPVLQQLRFDPDRSPWIRLEMRALALALEDRANPARRLQDAIVFRRVRQSLDPQQGVAEKTLEQYEGMAEFTVYSLTLPSRTALRAQAAALLRDAQPATAHAAIGLAYCLLLEEKKKDWRLAAGPTTDHIALLREAWKIPSVFVTAEELHARAQAYQ